MADLASYRENLAELAARAAIREQLTEYFDAVTRHDWDRVKRTFTPSATLDYGTPGVTAVDANVDLLRAGVDRLGVEVDTARDARRHRRVGRSGTLGHHDVHRPHAGCGGRPPRPNVDCRLRGPVVARSRRHVAGH